MNWSKKYRGKLEESKPSGPQCNEAQEFGPVATHVFGKFQMNPEDFKEQEAQFGSIPHGLVATVAWIDGKENYADAMTKRLSKVVQERLFGGWTY
eukprot:scaffold5841_cov81-Cylindrotheca_fusiformis.AAC.2